MKSLKSIYTRMALGGLLGWALGCGGPGEEPGSSLEQAASGMTPAGRQVLVSPEQLARQALLEVPSEARIVGDATRNRFLLLTSAPERPYALGKAVSCDSGPGAFSPVLLGGAIGCFSVEASSAAPATQGVTLVYLPLAAPAAEVGDAELLGAPEVEIRQATPGESRSCGRKPADFEAVMSRLAEDMLAQQEPAERSGTVRVALEYGSAAALWSAPASAFPELAVEGQVSGAVMEEPGVTCTCNSGSSGCTKAGGGLKPHYCDAGSCTSCTIN